MSRSIRSIDVVPVDMELVEPFGIATGARPVAENAFVFVELADGSRGVGEAAPFPEVNGETRAHAVAAMERVAPLLIGADAAGWDGELSAELRSRAPESPSARCAIETALLDALCRSRGESMWRYFGAKRAKLVSDITIPTGAAEHAARAAARAAARGFRTLKVKVGGSELEADEQRLRAILGAAPDCELLLDGNAALTIAAAIELARAAGERLVAFEQPLPRDDDAGARDLRRRGIYVIADESARTTAEVERLAANGAADCANLKITKSGLAETVRMAEAAKRAGLATMIGGMVESKVAMGASACFAAGFAEVSFVDLDTPWFLRDAPTAGGWTEVGPELDVSGIDAGHGVIVKARIHE